MKNELSIKILKNYLIMLIFSFVTEIIFKVVNNGTIFSWSILRIFLFLNFICLLISILISFYSDRVCKIIINIISLFVSIYSFFQLGFYKYIGTYMSVNSSSQAGKVVDYISDFVSSFDKTFYIVIIPYMLLVLYYIFLTPKTDNLKLERKEKRSKKDFKTNMKFNIPRFVFLGISILIYILFYLTLIIPFMQNKYQTVSNKSLFKYPEIQNITVNQFGVDAFLFLDLKSLFINQSVSAKEVDYQKKLKEVTDYTRTIDDSSWDQVIANETNSSYNSLNKYFISRDITDKNEYTGLFKGKNLIIIQMESVNDTILNYPEIFPNITKLYNEGWSFVNNYSPRNSCATGNNEMSAMTSLFTINNSCTANTYKRNTYYESIFNLFNNINYNTSSYHDYIEAYYSRKTIHPNMGSSAYYNAIDLKIPYDSIYQEWPSDDIFFENSFDKYINNDQFFAYLTTVTAHRPYGVSSEYGDKYLSLFSQYNYSIQTKRYMSKLKELDNGIGTLLRKLEESNKLNDTVIVLFADHYPYGLSDSQAQETLDYDITQNNERDRTPFIIYNTDLTPTKYEQYTTYMNILPTLANLFDLDYDPRLYFGSDILSKDYESVAIFTDGSWQNKKAFYDAEDGKIVYTSSSAVISDEEIIKINDDINTKINMSNQAIRTNYFNYLKGALSKYPSTNNVISTNTSTE